MQLALWETPGRRPLKKNACHKQTINIIVFFLFFCRYAAILFKKQRYVSSQHRMNIKIVCKDNFKYEVQERAATNAVSLQQLAEEYWRIDKFFLISFPILFFIFNIIYWLAFILWSCMFVILPLLYLKKINEMLGTKNSSNFKCADSKKELAWAEQFGGHSTNQFSAMPLVKACGSLSNNYPCFSKEYWYNRVWRGITRLSARP